MWLQIANLKKKIIKPILKNKYIEKNMPFFPSALAMFRD